jgi:hypothetical protein
MANFKHVVSAFPAMRHCFAYGSGVFHQPNLYTPGQGVQPMLDLIFAVDSPLAWHTQVQPAAPGRDAPH